VKIDVGNVGITAIDDGTVYLPPHYYPGVDWGAHQGLLDADGTYHIPAGCFLIETPATAILVDAGIGPTRIPFPPEVAEQAALAESPPWIAEGGRLPAALAAAGVDRSDISIVFLTHMHPDHIGWVAPAGHPYFPHAKVICSAADWNAPASSSPGEREARQGLRAVEAGGALRAIAAPSMEIVPGVTAHHAPGHTPGHYIVRIETDGTEAVLLGDAVHHPLQLNERRISFLLEDAPDAALATREKLLASLAGTDTIVNMAHFPGLAFHTIARVDGARRWKKVE
jgi:glyoxylase-like metal-dependent hydrolase (beta-lactamase superfamily II)